MKKFAIFALCMVMFLSLTGCGNKKAITSEKFILLAEEQGLNTTDLTLEAAATYSYVKSAVFAYNTEGDLQVEFYVLEDKDKAKSLFNGNKSIVEEGKTGSYKDKSINLANYNTYEISTNGFYVYISRVDNTLFYAEASESYKDEIKALVKKMGY